MIFEQHNSIWKVTLTTIHMYTLNNITQFGRLHLLPSIHMYTLNNITQFGRLH